MVPLPPCPAAIPVMWHPSIGICIGVLGFLGAIVPLTRTDIGRREKAVWTITFTIFLLLEILAIHLEDVKHEREQQFAQCENLRQFQDVAETLHRSIAINQENYDSTIGHVDGVLKKTKEVSILAQSNLENVTGGDSFAYVYPKMQEGVYTFPLYIHNEGGQILTGITVKIGRMIRGAYEPGVKSDVIEEGKGSLDPVVVGTLPAHKGEILPRYLMEAFRKISISADLRMEEVPHFD